MAGPDLVVRVAANISALQADMAKASASIKTIETTATDATTSASAAFGRLKSVASDLALGFAALFTARAALNFVDGVLHQASALVDLSQQTHITIEDVQRLGGAMSEFGVDQDTLAKGLFGLSRRIAKGEDSVANALGVMGLSLEDVRGLEGEDLFLAIEHGLATLQGGLRDTTASELFGSRLGMAMAGAAEGIDGAMVKARELNTVFSTESAKAMDEYSESIERAERSLTAIAANMIGPVAQGLNTLIGATEKGASKWAIAVAVAEGYYTSLTGMGRGAAALATVLDEVNQKTDKGVIATTAATVAHTTHAGAVKVSAGEVKAAAEAAAKWAAVMEELAGAGVTWHTTLDGIDGEVVEAVKYYLQAGVAQGTLATAYSLTAAQVKAVSSALADELAASKSLHEFEVAAAAREFEIAGLRLKATNDATIALLEEQKASEKVNADFLKGAYDDAIAQDKLNGILGEMPPQIDKLAPSFDRATQAAGVYMATLSSIVSDTNDLKYFGDNAQGSTARTLYGGGQSGYTADEAAYIAGGGFINKSLGIRDRGGPVAAGQPYYVGTGAQPELFVPSSAGTMYPAGGGGMTVHIHNHITQPLGTPDQIARVVGPAVIASLKNSGIRLPVGG